MIELIVLLFIVIFVLLALQLQKLEDRQKTLTEICAGLTELSAGLLTQIERIDSIEDANAAYAAYAAYCQAQQFLRKQVPEGEK